ncbi:uncharacterized protein CANTADRAFT_34704, partial [Suhomyces tanzawaensis NRRL Y-17324]
PSYTLVLNHLRVGPRYASLVALSSTCSYLRKVLGPLLFANLSLVRENQIDVVLATPAVMQQYSDKKRYHREFIKEVLHTNITECANAELAKTSFRAGINGDPSFQCNYQTSLGINNYITYVECDNSTVQGPDLALFPRLEALKVLDTSMAEPTDVSTAPLYRQLAALRFLSINASTLVHARGLESVLPQLTRLDLGLDFDDMDPVAGLGGLRDAFKSSRLRELNLFIDRSPSVAYVEFLAFIQHIAYQCKELCSLYIRVIRKQKPMAAPRQTAKGRWSVHQGRPLGSVYVEFLSKLGHLRNVGFDLAILRMFEFSAEPSTESTKPAAELSLTIVNVALTGTRLERGPLSGLVRFIRALKVTEIRLQYGEVVDNSHLQALTMLTGLVSVVCSSETYPYYDGLQRVSLERCWSVSDDSFRRRYYYVDLDLLPQSDHQLRAKLAAATVWGRTQFNSPRYKVRESFQVVHTEHHDHRSSPHLKASDDGTNRYGSSRAFWSVETSLAELEQYGVVQRHSQLW